MQKLSSVLKQLITERELNTSELARLTGILQPVMHRMVTGETDNPRIDTLLPIAHYFGITVEQLMGVAPIPKQHYFDKNKKQANHRLRYIPLLQWRDLAKNFNSKNIKPTTFIETNQPMSKQAYALQVKDSTMLPLFNENALLLIDPALQPENRDFCIVSIKTHPEPILRQVFFDGMDAYLKPLNSEFKTICLDKTISYRLLGVAVVTKTILKSRYDFTENV